MMRSSCGKWVGIILCLLCTHVAVGAEQPLLSDSAQGVPAVWKPQRFALVYRGDRDAYSCEVLTQKLQAILSAFGARHFVAERSAMCEADGSLVQLRVVFDSPVEATPANIRELTTYDSEQLLIARVRGERLPTSEELPQFVAEWRKVALHRDRSLGLTQADCDLVELLRDKVLPRLSVQIVSDDLRCWSTFSRRGPPRLTVSALVDASPDADM